MQSILTQKVQHMHSILYYTAFLRTDCIVHQLPPQLHHKPLLYSKVFLPFVATTVNNKSVDCSVTLMGCNVTKTSNHTLQTPVILKPSRSISGLYIIYSTVRLIGTLLKSTVTRKCNQQHVKLNDAFLVTVHINSEQSDNDTC